MPILNPPREFSLIDTSWVLSLLGHDGNSKSSISSFYRYRNREPPRPQS